MNFYRLVQFFLAGVSALIIMPSLANNKAGGEDGVTFKTFTVSAAKQKVHIHWSVKDAATTNYFEVQKSSDGLHYKTIALVLGADPKSEVGNSYGYLDTRITMQSRTYYRLMHIATNGEIQISNPKIFNKLK